MSSQEYIMLFVGAFMLGVGTALFIPMAIGWYRQFQAWRRKRRSRVS